MEEIRSAVHGYILDQFLHGEDPDALTDQTPLITGGILDSIRTLKLVVFLEDRFGVTVEAHEAGVENLDSVGQISRLIAKKKRAGLRVGPGKGTGSGEPVQLPGRSAFIDPTVGVLGLAADWSSAAIPSNRAPRAEAASGGASRITRPSASRRI